MGYSTPWSYSKLSLYKKCPAAFKYRYIDRIKTPMGDAAKRGVEIHEKLGAFISWGRVHEFSELGIKPEFEPLFTAFRDLYMATLRGRPKGEGDAPESPHIWNWSEVISFESQVKVDENWNVLPDDSKYYWATFIYDMLNLVPEAEVAKRLKKYPPEQFADVISTGVDSIIDFKTGKVYDTHKDQAAYYALSFWRVTGIVPSVSFLYVDQGEIVDFNFTAEELEAVEVDIRQTLQEIESDNTFACCSSSRNCGWCDFRKQGLCR